MEVTPKGCYGLRLNGIEGAAKYLGEVRATDPQLEITTEVTSSLAPTFVYSHSRAELALSDGVSKAVLDRSGHVHLQLGVPYDDEALLHPLLSGSFAIYNWWHGRDAFHAGAFVVNDKAWGVIGARGQGKSTTLGYLWLIGVPVLSDDVLVEDEGDVLAGPGFIDLRPDAGRQLEVGRDVGVLGSRARHRLDVEPAPRRVPLAGWLSLAWGGATRLVAEPVARRLPLLLENRAVLWQPAAPEAFLRYAAMPFFTLERPKDWKALPDVAELLQQLP